MQLKLSEMKERVAKRENGMFRRWNSDSSYE
jgi:hypothetical protein